MRILITGGAGQLGKALRAFMERERPTYEVRAPGHRDLDVTDEGAVREALTSFRPDVVVHLAAWTDVDGCERDPDRARKVHVEGTTHVIQAAETTGCWVWMASTDYVFDGEKGQAYVEDDPTHPLNVYGATKLEAEQVALAYPRAWVVRTSWVFGYGNNFVTKLLRWVRQGRLEIVADQVGSPTFTEDLAPAIVRFFEENLPPGVYHLANSGETTRYGWAKAILEAAGLNVPILPACSSAFPTPARRPRSTPLFPRRWLSLGFPPLPPWEEATRRFVRTLRP